MPLGPASPFDPAVVVEVPGETKPGSGTAFSVADNGVWLTARHVVEGCGQTALVVAEGRGVRQEWLHRTRDGRELWLDVDLRPLRAPGCGAVTWCSTSAGTPC